MLDYKEMYHKTFNAISDAERLIEQAVMLLKATQQECEDIVIESDDTLSNLSEEK